MTVSRTQASLALHEFSQRLALEPRRVCDSALGTTVEAIECERRQPPERQRDPSRIVERMRSEVPGVGGTNGRAANRVHPPSVAGCPPTQAFDGAPNGPGILEPIR